MFTKPQLKHIIYSLLATPVLIGIVVLAAPKSSGDSQPHENSATILSGPGSVKTSIKTPGKSPAITPSSTPSPKPTPSPSLSMNPSPNKPSQTPPPASSMNIESLQKSIGNMTKNRPEVYSIAFEKMGVNGASFVQNSKKMQSASTIKVFIMIEAYNQIKKGSLDINKPIILTNNMKVGGSGSLSSLKEGSKISISELIRLMITHSDNTATNILIDTLSFESINKTIKNLSCNDTILQRKMMDNKAIQQGKDNYTSVADLLNIFRRLYKNDCVGAPYDREMIEILKNQTINTKIPLFLPKGTVVAHKTGELPDVENDAGIVFSNKGDYILCIMTSKVNLADSANSVKNIIGNISKQIWNFI